MPRTPINYDNTIFYQILCRDTAIKDCYVGHTTDFKRRKTAHKSTCNNQNSRNHNIYLYKFIRDNGGWDNFDMILIENRECANSLDARKIERGHVEVLNSNLNRVIPSRTNTEWREENKEQLSINNKEYREINQEEISKQRKEYREENKELVKIQKETYYNNNKDKIAIHQKEFREKHKDEIQQYDRDRYIVRKDVMNQQKKDYRQNNLDEVRQKDKEKYQLNKEQRKEYYQLNREKILLQKKEYRNRNKIQTIKTNDEIIDNNLISIL
jgi:hypothetical protein